MHEASPKKVTKENRDHDSDDDFSRSRSRESSSAVESVKEESSLPQATTEELERLRARRRYRKKINGPGGVVNIWDVPEFMPGAKPRADPKERDAFERRSIAVFREQELANRQQAIEFELVEEERASSKMSEDISDLFTLFPKLDSSLVQETYLHHRGDRVGAIEELLGLSGENQDELPRASKSLNMAEFPSLNGSRVRATFSEPDEALERNVSYQAIVSKGRKDNVSNHASDDAHD